MHLDHAKALTRGFYARSGAVRHHWIFRRDREFANSSLEEEGFEPSVPPLGHGVSLRPYTISGEVPWRGHARKRSGATTDRGAHFGSKWAFRPERSQSAKGLACGSTKCNSNGASVPRGAHGSRAPLPFRSRAAVIVTLAALPILWTPNAVVARKVVGGFRVAIPGALLFAADGWIATGYVFVWQIALFRVSIKRQSVPCSGPTHFRQTANGGPDYRFRSRHSGRPARATTGHGVRLTDYRREPRDRGHLR